MEDNTNIEQNTQSDNMGNETEVQGTDKNTPKTFTQDEVNRFVQDRINRMRTSIEKESKAEYETKLAELQAREMKLLVKEKLTERNMPRELADIITCTDEKDLDTKLTALQKIYGNKATQEPEQTATGFRPLKMGVGNTNMHESSVDPVRRAMGLN